MKLNNPVVIDMDDGNTIAVKYFDKIPGHYKSYIIYFERFCMPERLRIDVSEEGIVSVWGQSDFDAIEGSVTLGGLQWIYGFCKFKISVDEAKKVLMEIEKTNNV